jgi:hypothetical protein
VRTQKQAHAAYAHARALPYAHTPTRECKTQGHATPSTCAHSKAGTRSIRARARNFSLHIHPRASARQKAKRHEAHVRKNPASTRAHHSAPPRAKIQHPRVHTCRTNVCTQQSPTRAPTQHPRVQATTTHACKNLSSTRALLQHQHTRTDTGRRACTRHPPLRTQACACTRGDLGISHTRKEQSKRCLSMHTGSAHACVTRHCARKHAHAWGSRHLTS